MTLVEFYDPVAKQDISYHISGKLEPKWKTLSQVTVKENSDRNYVVVGKERTGKSFFTFQQAKYIDPTFNVDRICFTPEQFLEQIRNAPEGSVVVFDEAFRGFSSKSSLSKVNKVLVQAMMEVGRRNLIIFIVLPSFSLLEWYIATHRSHALFQVYRVKERGKKYRGWRCYNNKKKIKIYYQSKKNYGMIPYTPTKLRDKFFVRKVVIKGKEIDTPYTTFELEKYEKKKENAFQGSDEPEFEGRMTEERRIFISNWFEYAKSKEKMNQTKFVEILKGIGVEMTNANLSILLSKTRKEGKILSFNS